MNIIFAGTPDFAVAPLQALALEHEIVAVFTQPDRKSGRGKKITPSPVKVEAEKQGIAVYQPLSLRGDALAEQTQLIASFNADVMVVVAYGMLLPQEILDTPRLGCLNIHGSLLPRWRGAAPIQRAIQAGDTETGVCIMKMELGLDTGPVYQTLKTPIDTHKTSADLFIELSTLGAKGICETLARLEKEPNWQPTIQNDDLSNYAKKITKQETEIDWSLSAKEIQCTIRAFNPAPICQTHHKTNRLRIWSASVLEQATTDVLAAPEPVGSITNISKQGIEVACGENKLLIQTLQKDGGKPLEAKQLLNGYDVNVGDIFGGIG